MAYDLQLAERIRSELAYQGIVEQKMFGGIGFMLSGNRVCGVHKNELMLHVAAADTNQLVARPGAKHFVMRDRPLQGWMLVEPSALQTQAALMEWINVALKYAQSLPAKIKTPKQISARKSKASVAR